MATAAAAAAAKNSTTINRSAYVSRLRRAFLLRAHPDRFRQHSQSIRKQQADVIQAISERFSCLDFLEYTTSGNSSSSNHNHPLFTQNNKSNNTYHYVLEKRDGSLLPQSISLNDNVQDVLQNMVNALESSGTCPGFPSPPPPPKASSLNIMSQEYNFNGTTNTTAEEYHRMHTFMCAAATTAAATTIDHQYDINTNKGTNLHHFFYQQEQQQQRTSASINNNAYMILNEEIKKRQAHRMDAKAAALVARRAFGFASIDGTNLGWSSEALAKCLLSLAELHEEHGEVWKVANFYPLSLVLSHGIKGLDGYDNEEQEEGLNNHGVPIGLSDENDASFHSSRHEKSIPEDLRIDLYGGIITLSPASTPLQWLNTLAKVSPPSLDLLRANRQNLQVYLDLIQNTWNVKMIRGHTCLSREYYHFTMNLYMDILAMDQNDKAKLNGDKDNRALALERIKVVVESSSNSRKYLPRGKITKQGDICITTSMSIHQIRSAITNLSNDARRIKQKEEEKQQLCSKRMNLLRDALGLRRVYTVKPSTVTIDQVLICLDRLLLLLDASGDASGSSEDISMQKAKMEELRYCLAGQSLGITGSGHFCHLGDDGSVLIPWDWHC